MGQSKEVFTDEREQAEQAQILKHKTMKQTDLTLIQSELNQKKETFLPWK